MQNIETEQANPGKEILLGKLTLETSCSLDFNQTHFFRGYIGNMFPEYNLLHNHQENKVRYHYPL